MRVAMHLLCLVLLCCMVNGILIGYRFRLMNLTLLTFDWSACRLGRWIVMNFTPSLTTAGTLHLKSHYPYTTPSSSSYLLWCQYCRYQSLYIGICIHATSYSRLSSKQTEAERILSQQEKQNSTRSHHSPNIASEYRTRTQRSPHLKKRC